MQALGRQTCLISGTRAVCLISALLEYPLRVCVCVCACVRACLILRSRRDVLKRQRERVGNDHPLTLCACEDLGTFLSAQQNYDEAQVPPVGQFGFVL